LALVRAGSGSLLEADRQQRLGIDGLSQRIASLVRHWPGSNDLPEGIGSGNGGASKRPMFDVASQAYDGVTSNLSE
jgi:hypothetical protein